jgi:hypothetical protein
MAEEAWDRLAQDTGAKLNDIIVDVMKVILFIIVNLLYKLSFGAYLKLEIV